MGTPFTIGPEDQVRIDQLVALAFEETIDYATMIKRVADYERGVLPPGLNSDKTLTLPFGWTVTFTVEEHRLGVPCRHLSLASPTPKRLPLPQAIMMAMDAFGFLNGLHVVATWTEELPDGRIAVNVIEPVGGDMNKLRVSQ